VFRNRIEYNFDFMCVCMHAEKQDYGEEGKEGARSRGEKVKTRVKEEFCFRCQREFCIVLVGGLTRSMVSFMYMIQAVLCYYYSHIHSCPQHRDVCESTGGGKGYT